MTIQRAFQSHDGLVHRAYETHGRFTYRAMTYCRLECRLDLQGTFVPLTHPTTCLLCLFQLAEEEEDDTAVTELVRRDEKEVS
jgi:hypothetical protein